MRVLILGMMIAASVLVAADPMTAQTKSNRKAGKSKPPADMWAFEQTKKEVGVEWGERVVPIKIARVRKWWLGETSTGVNYATLSDGVVGIAPYDSSAQRTTLQKITGKLCFVGEYWVNVLVEGKKSPLHCYKSNLSKPDQDYVKKLEKLLAEFRTWRAADGVHKVEAQLYDLRDGKIILMKRGYRTITLPVEKLSEEDRDWIEEHREDF